MAEETQGKKTDWGSTILNFIGDFAGGFATKDPSFGARRVKLMQELEDAKQEKKMREMRLKVMEMEIQRAMQTMKLEDMPISDLLGKESVTKPSVAGGVGAESPDVSYGVPETEPVTKTGEFKLENLFKGGMTVGQIPKFKALADMFKKEEQPPLKVSEKERVMVKQPDGTYKEVVSPSKTQDLPYKVGHIQEFKVGDETVYKEYRGKDEAGKDLWVDRSELGGKGGKNLFDKQEDAQKVATEMYNAIPQKDKAGVIPATKWVNGKFEPVLMPNIMERIPSGVPNFTTGISYDRRSREYTMDTPSGKIKLTAEQVKDLGLQAKEEVVTERTKTMTQLAPRVLTLAERVKKDIDTQVKQLGPAIGRWNDFWTRKVGAPNPGFKKLQTDVGLLSTLLANMHVGARGGNEIIKRFENMLESGKEAPENMIASINTIIEYAKETGQPVIKNPLAPENPPSPAPVETKVINGITYYKRNGKWYTE